MEKRSGFLYAPLRQSVKKKDSGAGAGLHVLPWECAEFILKYNTPWE